MSVETIDDLKRQLMELKNENQQLKDEVLELKAQVNELQTEVWGYEDDLAFNEGVEPEESE